MATIPDLTDADTWTDADLDRLRVAVLAEQERRYRLATAERRAEELAAQYHADKEVELPPLPEGKHRDWAQPTGAHDAYPVGAVVAHSGKVWKNTTPANVWEPGTGTLWKDVTANAPTPEPAPSAPPWRAGQAVKAGDLREHDGVVYAVVQPHTTQTGWEPPAVPALWKKA
ncbi:carbohydrate-binding protein [Micrococcus luteus]|uniref:carbohydrate-binding protein n=1 Tax=Micrococcus luteus TaxID=1270 RepID=UPI003D32F703